MVIKLGSARCTFELTRGCTAGGLCRAIVREHRMEGVTELGELQLCRGSGRGQRLENDVPLARVGVTDYDVLEAAWGPHVVAGPSTLSKSSGTEYQAQPEVRSAVMAEAADALPSHGDALGGEGAGDEEEDARSAQEGARASGGGWRIDVGDQEGQARG